MHNSVIPRLGLCQKEFEDSNHDRVIQLSQGVEAMQVDASTLLFIQSGRRGSRNGGVDVACIWDAPQP